MSQPQITPIIDSCTIQRAIDRIAAEITAAYDKLDIDRVEVVVILEGARRFADDLMTRLDKNKFHLNYLKASSYYGTTQSAGRVKITAPPDLNLHARHVLLLDDIYDTGLTMAALIHRLTNIGAADIKTAVLLIKNRGHEEPVPIDFHALEVEDLFVIGYGLDYQQKYRDLDYIGILKL